MSEYLKRKYTIYAVDFDGTLCESVFPGIGEPNMALIKHLIKRRKQGDELILWTCRVGERLQEAVEWCRGYGLEFDAVNENLPEMVEYWGGESRKVFADVYIDDKAVNKPKYCIPYKGGAKMSDELKLLDCPFCGGEAVLHVNDGVRVICTKCECRTTTLIDGRAQGRYTSGAVKSVIEKWNSRV